MGKQHVIMDFAITENPSVLLYLDNANMIEETLHWARRKCLTYRSAKGTIPAPW